MSTQDFDAVIKLLEELKSPGIDGNKQNSVEKELLYFARSTGSGAFGTRGNFYQNMLRTVESDSKRKQQLIDNLECNHSLVRSWTGSFIEQLFKKEEAISLLKKALKAEGDPEAASWFCLYLGRLTNDDKEVCKLIQETFFKVSGHNHAQLETARAWGYARCKAATKYLRDYLEQGGYVQKNTALDGYIGLVSSDKVEEDDIKIILHTFKTTMWSDLAQRCAVILTFSTGKYLKIVIQNFIDIICSQESNDILKNITTNTLIDIAKPGIIVNDNIEKLIKSIKYNSANINGKIAQLFDLSVKDWETIFVDRIIKGEDNDLRVALAHTLSISEKSRQRAVDILKSGSNTNQPEIQERITKALVELGGEKAFQSLKEILEHRYIRPSDNLREFSQEIFEDTVKRMRRNYNTSMFMNRIVFGLGILVILIGLILVIFDPMNNQFFGTAGIVTGLGTLVSLFFFGPLQRIQNAMTELVQIEVSFMAYMHRILQTRSIFEQLYITKKIDIDILTKFDKLLNDGMIQTVELIESNTGTNSLKNKTK